MEYQIGRSVQTFVVNSSNDSSSIDFSYPLKTDFARYRYSIRFTSVSLQFTYRNVEAPNNTITLTRAPLLTGGPVVYTLPPGAYTFNDLQSWWNSLDWKGAISNIQANPNVNRVAIELATGSTIILSNFAQLLGSKEGTISNSSGSTLWFVCDNAPQFSPMNALLTLCTGVNSGVFSPSSGSFISNVVAYLSLSNTSPGQYLEYRADFGSVPEYSIMSPSFTIIIADDYGKKVLLDNTLKTVVGFHIIASPITMGIPVVIIGSYRESEPDKIIIPAEVRILN